MTQTEALDILKTGANVFITGPAGSGKTYVVNQYIAYLRSHNVPVGITASTGIAATHMGGMTIHAWAGIGIKDSLNDYDLDALMEKTQLRRRIEETKVLIIDEVSMLHHFRLDLVDSVLRHVKKTDAPFGGMQVVLCGDFFQLPPVSRMGEPVPRFIYHSNAWKEGDFNICYLSENFRQKNDISLTILNEIRSGEVSDEAREHLRGRFSGLNIDESEDEDKVVSKKNLLKDSSYMPTRLFTHNADVDGINETELGKLAGPEYVYEMSSRGRKNVVDAIKKTCLAPEVLRLRKGSRVMCVKNNFDKGYVNGTLGVVVSCGPGVDPVIRTYSTAEHPQGRTITIEQASWKIDDEGKVIAEIIQYPLRLAWAITVHKSQGMSLDAVEVDLSRSFEPGMGYVALSRVRTLAGLRILGMNEMAFQVHPEVLEHDRHIRERSREAEAALVTSDRDELIKRQHEFLAKVAPLHKIETRKVSTLEKTAALIHKKKTLKDIAKNREITVETVIAHIEELIKTDSADFESISLDDIAYLKYEISPQHFGKIEKALEEVYENQDDSSDPADSTTPTASKKPPLLSPVKSKLGPNISFKDIRLARVLLGYIK